MNAAGPTGEDIGKGMGRVHQGNNATEKRAGRWQRYRRLPRIVGASIILLIGLAPVSFANMPEAAANGDGGPVADADGPYVIDEGDSLTLDATGTANPNGNPLTFRWDVDGDGDYDENVTGVTPTINSVQLLALGLGDGPDSNAVTVEVSDGFNVDTASSTLAINNVAPTINAITANGPVPQGQPVTVTVDATDAGIPDVLQYAFDCNNDGNYETGLQAGNSTNCMLDPAISPATIGVQVVDDDGGSTFGSVAVLQTVTLCGNFSTGRLSQPLANGNCQAGSFPLVLPMPQPLTLCVSLYTGQLTWQPGGQCSFGQRPHVVPGRRSIALLSQSLDRAAERAVDSRAMWRVPDTRIDTRLDPGVTRE